MSTSRVKAKSELAKLFERNGYTRIPDLTQREEVGSQIYKKGYEIRLAVKNESELNHTINLLETINIRPGKPFIKNNRPCLPIYGKEAVFSFIELINPLKITKINNLYKRNERYNS